MGGRLRAVGARKHRRNHLALAPAGIVKACRFPVRGEVPGIEYFHWNAARRHVTLVGGLVVPGIRPASFPGGIAGNPGCFSQAALEGQDAGLAQGAVGYSGHPEGFFLPVVFHVDRNHVLANFQVRSQVIQVVMQPAELAADGAAPHLLPVDVQDIARDRR